MGGEPARSALVVLPAPVPPSAEVRAAAAKAGWSPGPLALVTEPGLACAGDGVVALITLWSGATQKQWLVQFEVDRLNEQEKHAKTRLDVTIGLSSTKQTWTFSGAPTFALKIRAIGPFVTLPPEPKTAAKSAVDKTARAPIIADFLSIGLDRACRVFLNQGNAPSTDGSPSNANLAEADEKAVGGSFVALLQFFRLAQETPGLKEIIGEILDLPPVWSLARSLGKIEPGFDMGTVPPVALDPAGWSLPKLPLYRLPFGITLNGKPAVHCAFFVTAPDPPLLTTAGILGFTAESPSHKDKRMLVQIVSAYRGQLPGASTNVGPP